METSFCRFFSLILFHFLSEFEIIHIVKKQTKRNEKEKNYHASDRLYCAHTHSHNRTDLSLSRQFIGHHIDFMLEIETILYIFRYSFSCRSFYFVTFFSSRFLCVHLILFYFFPKFWNSYYNQYGIVEVGRCVCVGCSMSTYIE